MLDHQVLSALLEKYRGALGKPVRTFTLGGRLFDFNRYRYLVGVINLSTDSWYRESVCATTAEAIARAEMLHTDGADIIDIGAESTCHTPGRPIFISNWSDCYRSSRRSKRVVCWCPSKATILKCSKPVPRREPIFLT